MHNYIPSLRIQGADDVDWRRHPMTQAIRAGARIWIDFANARSRCRFRLFAIGNLELDGSPQRETRNATDYYPAVAGRRPWFAVEVVSSQDL
jgi:hypothetical protein